MKFFKLFFTLGFVITIVSGASLNENRSGVANSSDTSVEMPLSMFYDYNFLLPYLNQRITDMNKAFVDGIDMTQKSRYCGQGLKSALNNIINIFKPVGASSYFSPAAGASFDKILPSGTRECEYPISGDIVGTASARSMGIQSTARFSQLNMTFQIDTNSGLLVKRDGRIWYSIGNQNVIPFYGGRAIIQSDGSNFTIYKGFWSDNVEKAQDKYEKEVRYACGLIEKAKALKGKKISENEARTYFANITPCSYSPNINPGTVIFDLQQNIVLGQKIVLNEKSSKEKSSSSSTQELRY